MGTRRLGFALVAALIISIALTSIFYIRVTRAQSSTRPHSKRVVAAAAALQPGVPITAENLTEINWPVSVSLEGLIEKKEDAIGRVPIYAMEAAEPILKYSLAPNGSFGLAAKIPDGMRATSVKTNEVMNIAGFMFPGSHVDVLVTLRGDNSASSATTRTVLQNVQVLATGTKTTPDPNGKPENVGVVTLLVTPEESEKLALAQSQAAQNQGSIHFVLRNGGDSATPNTAPVDMAELAGIPKKVPQKVPYTKRVPAPKAPEPYLVETMAGGKITVAKFPVTIE
jgi:pilus assembly protein CpaB